MPRGEKAGNTGVKPHRARKIAESLRRRGATRKAANEIATAAMNREYSPKRSGNPRKAKHSFDEEAHDSRTGQRKTNLTTKRAAVSGARKPSRAANAAATKRNTKLSDAAAGRRPRASAGPGTRKASSRQSTVGKRPTGPRKATRQRSST